jgi:hypothetical protein
MIYAAPPGSGSRTAIRIEQDGNHILMLTNERDHSFGAKSSLSSPTCCINASILNQFQMQSIKRIFNRGIMMNEDLRGQSKSLNMKANCDGFGRRM